MCHLSLCHHGHSVSWFSRSCATFVFGGCLHDCSVRSGVNMRDPDREIPKCWNHCCLVQEQFLPPVAGKQEDKVVLRVIWELCGRALRQQSQAGAHPVAMPTTQHEKAGASSGPAVVMETFMKKFYLMNIPDSTHQVRSVSEAFGALFSGSI